ncbi:MAG TPA: hypothetical protein VEK15_28025 [Vicinamibacteria bacterium]|nr:hypothetical protein [Vicinamibacteria bacterium]
MIDVAGTFIEMPVTAESNLLSLIGTLSAPALYDKPEASPTMNAGAYAGGRRAVSELFP